MAVFLLNICKFNGCGITFPSLGALIKHIEDNHIDYDPKVVEQKEQAHPASLPLSYVLRFVAEDPRKENQYVSSNMPAAGEIKRKLAIKHHSYSMSSSNRSNTPTGSEMDEDEMPVSESEDSNESWTTEEFSPDFIMRYGSRHSGNGSNGTAGGNEKPFACPVPGCKKRYKNVNGIKYHSKNGHKKDGKVRKGYKCHCGKSYKTAQGLKGHALSAHNASSTETVLTPVMAAAVNNVAVTGGIIQRSSSPSQSLGSLSPSSISNMSSSASSHGGGSSSSNSNNILQQLTNSSIGSSNGGSSGYVTATTQQTQQALLQQQQQQQQQFTVNNNAALQPLQQQHNATTEISYSSSSSSSNANAYKQMQKLNKISATKSVKIKKSKNLNANVATATATGSGSGTSTALAPKTPAAMLLSNNFMAEPKIAPTFIEHKLPQSKQHSHLPAHHHHHHYHSNNNDIKNYLPTAAQSNCENLADNANRVEVTEEVNNLIHSNAFASATHSTPVRVMRIGDFQNRHFPIMECNEKVI